MNEHEKKLIVSALSYITRFRNRILVVKYGGSALHHNEDLAAEFARDIVLLSRLNIKIVIVHGGGPDITEHLERLGIKSQFKDGLRVTTAEGLNVSEMVLSGRINKKIVALLNSNGAMAVGLSGKDGNMILAKKLNQGADLGWVGEVVGLQTGLLQALMDKDYIPVISPIGIDEHGQSYNINADTVATNIAVALSAEKIVFMTNVDGVLKNNQLVSSLTTEQAEELIQNGVVSGGMIPKVQALLNCVRHGVMSAAIVNGNSPHAIIQELLTQDGIGTIIS